MRGVSFCFEKRHDLSWVRRGVRQRRYTRRVRRLRRRLQYLQRDGACWGFHQIPAHCGGPITGDCLLIHAVRKTDTIFLQSQQTGLPFDCEQPGRGWTGMDRTCSFHRLAGASGVTDAWALWNAAPNGTDPHDGTKKLPRAETWYKRLNSADAKPFLETAVGECRQYLEPPPPATPRERREWVVFLDGAEEGPYTRLELETGSITVTELTGVSVAVPLLPATLVGKVTRSAQTQTVVYGATSRYQTRVDSWRTRMAGRFVSSAVGTEQMNVVNVDGFATKLTHWAADAESGTYASVDGGSYATGTNANTATSNAVAFLPMAVMPGMERGAYWALEPKSRLCVLPKLATVCLYIAQHGTDTFFPQSQWRTRTAPARPGAGVRTGRTAGSFLGIFSELLRLKTSRTPVPGFQTRPGTHWMSTSPTYQPAGWTSGASVPGSGSTKANQSRRPVQGCGSRGQVRFPNPKSHGER